MRYGENGRFYIRTHLGRGGDVAFMVHDADWVTDAEMRAGRSSPVVSQHTSIGAARQWCDDVEAGKVDSVPHPSNFEGWDALKQRVAEHDARRKVT